LVVISSLVYNNPFTESKEMVTNIVLGVLIGWSLFSLVKAFPWFFSGKGMFGASNGLNLPGRILMWLSTPFWLPLGVVGVAYDKIRGR
jgi:F0F1-type ATP synthase assembly protein I